MSEEKSKNHKSKSGDKNSGFSTTRIIKNAFANVARGGATALITILMPPFLVKILTKEEYGTWLLILQLSTYVNFLGFGIQTAIGKFVAHTTELENYKQRNKIVSTALAVLIVMGFIAVAGLLVCAWQIPHIFNSMPQELHQEAQIALLLVGGSLAVGLPLSTFGGIFIGLQRYDIPGWIIGMSQIIGGVLIILVAHATHSIVWMGCCMALASLGASIGQYLAYQKFNNKIQLLPSFISKEAGEEILKYCFAISIWNLGILLVSGLDTTIVGYFDYSSIVYYSLAVNVTSFIIQLQSAVFSVLMPAGATLAANNDTIKLGNLLEQSTRYGMIILLMTGIPLITSANQILTPWIGIEYASKTAIFVQVLVIANILRLSALPYAILMMAIGQHRLIIVSPLVEGIFNFVASVLLTSRIGAVGAAYGTVLGSIISLAFHFLYNMPRTVEIKINRKHLITKSIMQPIKCVAPCILIYFLSLLNFNIKIQTLLTITSFGTSLFLVWNYSLEEKERNKIISYIYLKLA